MQQAPQHDEVAPIAEDDAPLWTPVLRRRLLLGMIAALCVLLLVVVPPYVSVSRYQRRVATAISGALGRPVHFDSITLHLLPLPGLTITNFVVSESPEFGWEPVLRANTVEARLRISSLWRRRIEVSRISLDAPSINLVRREEDGRWNLQGILLQASQLNSAPTAQQRAGEAPRFPYIEATDARINLKNGDSKLPFSVKEAEFALWLPQPDGWRLRMVGKPVRTDTDVNDVGLLRVEGTLGRGSDLPNTSIDLQAAWKPTPLGEAAKLTAGYDLGWRGEAAATASLRGTLGAGHLVTDLHLRSLHRADFLPEHSADVEAHCEAATAGVLRSLHDVRCAVPTDTSLSLASVMDVLRNVPAHGATDTDAAPVKPGVLLLRGDVPNVLDWSTASGTAALTGASAEYALVWAELFTQSVPAAVTVGGTVNLTASLRPTDGMGDRWTAALQCVCILPRPKTAGTPSATPETASTSTENRWIVTALHTSGDSSDKGTAVRFAARPDSAPARDGTLPTAEISEVPAGEPSVSGTLQRDGYHIQYGSRSDLDQAAALVPRLRQGVPEGIEHGLESQGGWSTPPVWSATAAPAHKASSRRDRHRTRRHLQ